MTINNVIEPYGLVQKAGKKRIYRKKTYRKKRIYRKTRKHYRK